MNNNILILGSSGLVGYDLFNNLSTDNSLNVYGLVRNNYFSKKNHKLIKIKDILNFNKLQKILNKLKPNVIVNCISLEKEKWDDIDKMIDIYHELPFFISNYSTKNKIKFINISTDAVFSGSKGFYDESDLPDPTDEYGKIKYLSENISTSSIVIRATFVGIDKIKNNGISNWLLNSNKKIIGYSGYYFSPIPTQFFYYAIKKIIKNKTINKGLYHLGSKKISKYQYLNLLAKKFQINTIIDKSSSIKVNRVLNSAKFDHDFDFFIPEWEKLINYVY